MSDERQAASEDCLPTGTTNTSGRLPSWLLPDVLVPFVATRTVLWIVGLLTINLLPHRFKSGQWEESSHDWINMWSRWDAGWYMAIAQHGYSYHPGEQSSVAFFPLYPMLMRGLAFLIGRPDGEGCLLAGILISNACLLLALVYLVRLLHLDYDASTASRAVFYLLVFPTSFYFSAVYTESLFLLLSVASFYHARRRQWWLAGLAGGCASLTRVPGILLFLPLCYEYLVSCRFDIHKLRLNALALALVPAGVGSYMAYLAWRFHDPLAFMHVEAAWGRQKIPPWELIASYLPPPFVLHTPERSFLDLCVTIFFGFLVVRCWRTTRTSYALYASLSFALMLCSGSLQSIMRYGLALFPLFIVLAQAGRAPSFDRSYTSIALGLGAFFLALFALWNWVA